MEYKLSSFNFCQQVTRESKHHVIKRINSVRSKCPSDASFTGDFQYSTNVFIGEIKVLFSKGSFFVSGTGLSIEILMKELIDKMEDQIAMWKEIRFDQPETFIEYGELYNKKIATSN